MNKKLIIVLSLIGLTTVVSGCVKKPVLSPTNQNINTAATTTSQIDTTGWKTYRNEKYGFEFKYPREWTLIDLETTKGYVLESPNYHPFADGVVELKGEIYINLISNPKKFDIKTLFSTFDDVSKFWFSTYPYKALNFDGMESFQFDPIVTGKLSRKETIISTKLDYVVSFAYLYQEKDEGVGSVYDKLVETFRAL